MINGEGKQIILQDCPNTNSGTFLKPTCRGTVRVLPKINSNHHHHHHKHNKQLNHLQSYKKCKMSRPLPDHCVDSKEQHHSSKVEMKPTKKMGFSPSQGDNKLSIVRSFPKKTRVSIEMPSMVNRILPNLKRFNSDELSEAESRHKVYRPVHFSSLNARSISEAEQQKHKSHCVEAQARKSRDRSRTESDSLSEYVQTEPKYFQSANKEDKQGSFKKTKPEAEQLMNDRYYEYLENDSNINEGTKKGQSDVEEAPSHVQGKQEKESTIFHASKQKPHQNENKGQKRPRSSHGNSILSNGLFQIPEEQQLGDYLLKYQPMSPSFDLRSLVREADFHIIPEEGKVYFGQVADQKRHGKGITISQKEIYEGKYEEDIKVEGCEKNQDGIYVGEYLKGKRHGKGKFAWYNGELFEGEWRNGRKNGFGVWKSPKGDCYEGQWVENRQNGEGCHFHLGGSKYRGHFKDFLKHGKGTEEFQNGDSYSGQYSFGKPSGKGRYAWANGDTYEGSFQDGSRSGYGIIRRKSGQTYEGHFQNDLKHGLGKQTCAKTGKQWEGEFHLGKRVP